MKYINFKTFSLGVVILLVWGLVLYNSTETQDSEVSNSQSEEQHDDEQTITGEPNIYSVVLNNTKSDPITAQVKVGDFIQFSSDDGQQHQIIQSGEGEHGDEALDSGVLNSEQAYRVRFSDEGSFVLGDSFNPDLRITVIVSK